MNYKEWQIKFENYLLENQSDDGSHDISHFQRVWCLANRLSSEKEDKLVILAACYFHDIVNYPKNSPLRSMSSNHAARKAVEILKTMEFPNEKLNDVFHCIEAHSYSANIETKSMEAKIVQDSDRMESLGAIGIARTFYVAGRMGSKLFNSEDPFAEKRKLDDTKYAIDHFENKLLKLSETMKTEAGRIEARIRTKVLTNFLETLKLEL